MVGAVAAGHDTVDQVTDLEPVASCFNIMMKDLPALWAGIVTVALPVKVNC